MPTNLKFRSWLKYEIESVFINDGSILIPDPTLYYALVGNDVGIADTSDKSLVIAAEQLKTATNGYQRFNVDFGNAAVFDNSNKRWQLPIATWTLALPEAIDYNFVALLANCRPESNIEIDTVTTGNPGTFTIDNDGNGHLLDSDEEVMISADSGGSLPGGVSATTVYYAEYISFDQFQLKTDPLGSPINITSAGSQVRLRYAKGDLVGFRKEDVVENLPANSPISWNFSLTNAAYFGVGQGS